MLMLLETPDTLSWIGYPLLSCVIVEVVTGLPYLLSALWRGSNIVNRTETRS